MKPIAILTAAAGLLAAPAWTPELTVVAAGVTGHGIAHTEPAAAGDASWSVGAVEIMGPFARATLPNAPVAGGFMSIRNHGDEDDRLVAAASAVAGRMEVHEMTMKDDVMRMRELADGLPIRAGATVDLIPGGYHLMFVELRHPLVEGETVDVTLTFEEAGEITVPLAIGPVSARVGEMDHEDMDHSAMDH